MGLKKKKKSRTLFSLALSALSLFSSAIPHGSERISQALPSCRPKKKEKKDRERAEQRKKEKMPTSPSTTTEKKNECFKISTCLSHPCFLQRLLLRRTSGCPWPVSVIREIFKRRDGQGECEEERKAEREREKAKRADRRSSGSSTSGVSSFFFTLAGEDMARLREEKRLCDLLLLLAARGEKRGREAKVAPLFFRERTRQKKERSDFRGRIKFLLLSLPVFYARKRGALFLRAALEGEGRAYTTDAKRTMT